MCMSENKWNIFCSHHFIDLCPYVYAKRMDPFPHKATQVATAVFYYPGKQAFSVRSWLLALTFLCHQWLRVQVSHYLFLLIVYSTLMWQSNWLDRKQEPNDTRKILRMSELASDDIRLRVQWLLKAIWWSSMFQDPLETLYENSRRATDRSKNLSKRSQCWCKILKNLGGGIL